MRTTDVTLIRVPQLAAAPYAYASTIPASARLIFLAGACPIDVEGVVIHSDDIAAQTRHCLENLDVALSAVDASLTDIVSTRVLVVTRDRHDLTAAWAVVSKWFGDHAVPSTLLGVTVLGYDGQLVEIEATAGIVD
ncbi:RidA family protein [Lacisediminihabitans changchengi]|uniref:RidA family protein n=1 Tax=Lacisediminihabitans changchengi TaxID=2787634 RepID=A0A934SIJ1_9MICO|nr:Rid family hydrolase [Lacisediminihabitans changchengi]MBK4347301.1 RidA family protein [Lacisediminihabitans changchengi]